MKKSELIKRLNEIEGDFDVFIYDYLKSSEGEAGDGYYKLNSDDVFLDGEMIRLSFKNIDYDFEGCPEKPDGTTPALGVFLKTDKGDFCFTPRPVNNLNYYFVCGTDFAHIDWSRIVDYNATTGQYKNYNPNYIDFEYGGCKTAEESLQSFLDKHNLTVPQYIYKIN